jgi:hypothetical protein
MLTRLVRDDDVDLEYYPPVAFFFFANMTDRTTSLIATWTVTTAFDPMARDEICVNKLRRKAKCPQYRT